MRLHTFLVASLFLLFALVTISRETHAQTACPSATSPHKTPSKYLAIRAANSPVSCRLIDASISTYLGQPLKDNLPSVPFEFHLPDSNGPIDPVLLGALARWVDAAGKVIKSPSEASCKGGGSVKVSAYGLITIKLSAGQTCFFSTSAKVGAGGVLVKYEGTIKRNANGYNVSAGKMTGGKFGGTATLTPIASKNSALKKLPQGTLFNHQYAYSKPARKALAGCEKWLNLPLKKIEERLQNRKYYRGHKGRTTYCLTHIALIRLKVLPMDVGRQPMLSLSGESSPIYEPSPDYYPNKYALRKHLQRMLSLIREKDCRAARDPIIRPTLCLLKHDIKLEEMPCDHGDVNGCYKLANKKANGDPSDKQRARIMYKKACALQHAAGCFAHGNMLERGQGGPADKPLAMTAYNKACKAGISKACQSIKRFKIAENAQLNMACNSGDAKACYKLGKAEKQTQIVLNKLCNKNKYSKACAALSKLHKNNLKFSCLVDNDVQACIDFARKDHTLTNSGLEPAKGRAENMRETRIIYDKACKGGAFRACAILGRVLGGTKGRTMLVKACKGGYADACLRLGYKLKKGSPVDQKQARRFYRMACDGGISRACYLLGRMFGDGKGGRRDSHEAKRYYAKSCKLGDTQLCAINH